MTAEPPVLVHQSQPIALTGVDPEQHIESARSTQRRRAYDHLGEQEPVLRTLVALHGLADPFDWDGYGRTGHNRFRTFAFLIIGQAVTRYVAAEQYDAATRGAGEPLTAQAVAGLGHPGLITAGLAPFKATALIALSRAIIENRLDLDDLDEITDDQILSLLTRIPGVGRWAVELFLIRGLHRPDVLPGSDPALRSAIQRSWSLPALPSASRLDALAGSWRPYRSFASALLWASVSVGQTTGGPAAGPSRGQRDDPFPPLAGTGSEHVY